MQIKTGSRAADKPEDSLLASLVLPRIQALRVDRAWIVPRIRRGTDQDGPQQTVEAVVAVGRIVHERDCVIVAVLLTLNGHPILVGLFVSVRGFFGSGAGHRGEDSCACECSWNFKFQDLFMLLPID